MEITQLLINMRINTKYLSARSADKSVDINITFDVQNSEQLQAIIGSISRIDSVIKVERNSQVPV